MVTSPTAHKGLRGLGVRPIHRRDAGSATTLATLRISWPWWVHPAWALTLLTGSMAVVSIALPAEFYSTWRTPKYLDGNLSLLLMVNLLAMFVGILVSSGAAARGGTTEVRFTERQIRWMQSGYKLMFALMLIGYAIWVFNALRQGVGPAQLASVLERNVGAISDLKADLTPIGGVTTLTQFGPVVIVLGFILHKLGYAKRWYWLVLVLASVRFVFYAERLALIEVLVPLILIAALTIRPGQRFYRLVRLGPILAGPLLWALFAVSEYNRSWVFYQSTTTIPFEQWVTLRLIGYYTTSYNNSALLYDALIGSSAPPYYSITAFWNAPGVEQALPYPGILGMSPGVWWDTILKSAANPEFTNNGSFLMTSAEMGTPASLLYWFVTGVIIGAVFVAMTRGSLPGLLATVTLFIGLLELPRLVYWSLGRTTPFVIALLFFALFYPRTATARRRQLPGAYRDLIEN